MASRIVSAVVFCFALVISSVGLAAQNNNCEEWGFSCANLVYQGFTYPYERESGSYLYINSGIYPYVTATENLLGDSTVRLPNGRVIAVDTLLNALGLERKSGRELTPLVGYGSNPSPVQLERKIKAKDFGGDVVVPVMKGTLKDFDVAWTPVFVSYGSMPSTLTPSKGTEVEVWITWLDQEISKIMDGTEHANVSERPLYVRSTLTQAQHAFDGPEPEPMHVYISCFGPLTVDGKTYAVRSVPAKGRNFEPATSPEAVTKVMPTLGWNGGVLELLYDNVIFPENRAKRSTALVPMGGAPDIPGAEGLDACKEDRAGAQKPY